MTLARLLHIKKKVVRSSGDGTMPRFYWRFRHYFSTVAAVADLGETVKTGERSRGTQRGYKNAVEDFRDNCGVQFMEEVTGEALRRYKVFMFDHIKKRIHGTKHNTVAKRFRFLNTFFNKFGVKMVKDRMDIARRAPPTDALVD